MTEFDLQALGIWWIPLPSTARRTCAPANVWAIEDRDFGISLLGCGDGSPECLTSLSNGLAEASATLRDVGRIVVAHADEHHAGGLSWIAANSAFPVEIVASAPVQGLLPAFGSRRRELRPGDRLEFKHFSATALRCPGVRPGMTCLFARSAGLLFTSDHLLDDSGPSSRESVLPPSVDVEAYRASLERLAELPVSVVLPGRGTPFAGHRRVIREALARLAPASCINSEAHAATRITARTLPFVSLEPMEAGPAALASTGSPRSHRAVSLQHRSSPAAPQCPRRARSSHR